MAGGDPPPSLALACERLVQTDTVSKWTMHAMHAELTSSPVELRRHLARGLAAAARGLELLPEWPRLLAVQAALHVAVASSQPDAREASLRYARAAMARGRELHAWIHVEFADTVATFEQARGEALLVAADHLRRILLFIAARRLLERRRCRPRRRAFDRS